jgi:lipopolysaccharide/colanic/teichoic acid biosynthesis glycosyltransferase
MVTTFSFQPERPSALQSALSTHRSRAAEVADTARTLNWGSPLPAATSTAKRIIDLAGALVGLCIMAVLVLPIALVRCSFVSCATAIGANLS